MIEWHALLPSKVGPDTWTITEQRIARFSHLLKKGNRLITLHALGTIGLVDLSGAHHFGQVLRLPSWSSNSHSLMTLHQLRSRDLPSRLVNLDELAAMLAKSSLFEAKEGQTTHFEAIG